MALVCNEFRPTATLPVPAALRNRAWSPMAVFPWPVLLPGELDPRRASNPTAVLYVTRPVVRLSAYCMAFTPNAVDRLLATLACNAALPMARLEEPTVFW